MEELSTDRRRLIEVVARHVNGGRTSTALPGLTLYRRLRPTALSDAIYPPSLSLVVQGSKRTVIGANDLRWGNDRFLITPIDIPVVSQVLVASEAIPYLGLMLRLDTALVADVLATGAIRQTSGSAAAQDPTGTVEAGLLSSSLRMVQLLDTPQDIPVLAPLALRELVYRLARSDWGHRLWWPATDNSGPGARIARAVSWLKAHYAEPLRVPALAGHVSMSASSFHEHFRAATGMTPLQYQKALRLGEARRLLLVESFSAATAAQTVGYASPAQFSREYRRLYGESPSRDARRMRQAAAVEGVS